MDFAENNCSPKAAIIINYNRLLGQALSASPPLKLNPLILGTLSGEVPELTSSLARVLNECLDSLVHAGRLHSFMIASAVLVSSATSVYLLTRMPILNPFTAAILNTV